ALIDPPFDEVEDHRVELAALLPSDALLIPHDQGLELFDGTILHAELRVDPIQLRLRVEEHQALTHAAREIEEIEVEDAFWKMGVGLEGRSEVEPVGDGWFQASHLGGREKANAADQSLPCGLGEFFGKI